MTERETPGELELELAALGELPEERTRALVERGHGDELERLRALDATFHAKHDRDFMLATIHRRHRQHARTEFVRVMALSMTVMLYGALGIGATVWALSLLKEDTSRGPREPVGIAQIDLPPCDMTREWHMGERDVDGPYELAMRACVHEGRVALKSRGTLENLSPPPQFVYACRQYHTFGCAALLTFESEGFGGIYPMDRPLPEWIDAEFVAERISIKMLPRLRHWQDAMGSPRYSSQVRWAQAIDREVMTCDDRWRTWDDYDRDYMQTLDAPFIPNDYMRTMSACIEAGEDKLAAPEPPKDGHVELEYACAQRSSFACAILGGATYFGRWPVHGDEPVKQAPVALEQRVAGATAMRRSCALENINACAALALILEQDEEVRVSTGYDPVELEIMARPYVDVSRGDPDAFR